MSNLIRPYLKGELFNIKEYLKRLFFFHQSLQLDDFNLRNIIQHFYEVKLASINTNFHFTLEAPKDFNESENFLVNLCELMDKYVELNSIKQNNLYLHLQLLIDLYDLATQLHLFIDPEHMYHIETPRPVLMLKTDSFPHRYEVNNDLISEINENHLNVLQLAPKKIEKHQELLKLAKQDVSANLIDNAIEKIEKAISYHPTAQAYTFLGWVLSNKEDLDAAISACKQAIEIDLDFGNPYNDIGSYLLVQKKVNESIDWFKRAKAAAKYTNREYPFINLGKAYLMLGQYSLSLAEFKYAQKIAPQNQNVIETIKKIESMILTDNPVTNPRQDLT